MVRKTAFRTERRFVRLRAALAVLLCAAMLLTSSGLLPLSVYALFGDSSRLYSVSSRCRCTDGNTYKVTVGFSDETGIPHNADLRVEEITEEDELYDVYIDRTQQALRTENSMLLLDISLVDHDDEDLHLQPADGTTVDVRIRMADADALQDVRVVHFPDGTHMPQVMQDVEVDEKDISFKTDGFSAYAIVTGPSPSGNVGWTQLESVSDLLDHTSDGVYIGHVDGYFLRNTITNIKSGRTGITKTKPPTILPPDNAVPYFFEPVSGTTDQFRVYCMSANGTPQYVRQNSTSLSFTSQANATIFTVEPYTGGNTPIPANTFRIFTTNTNYCWNMQGGASGASFAAWEGKTEANAMLQFLVASPATDDIYGLGGHTYGLMNYTGGVTGRAMMARATDDQNTNALQALDLAVLGRSNDRTDQLFVPNSSDISMWEFEWVENDKYYLRTNADGSTKYLRIDTNGVTLVSSPENDDNCKITVIPGSGAHAGQICLKVGTNTLTYSGALATGFTVGGTAGTEWLNLVQEAELTQDYLMTYSARKVSVSDPEVTNGTRLIVYTRVWNNTTRRYEFYAIDYDGSLIPCYESGDYIQWVGNRINTELWNFVEYYWEGTNDPNFYYELYNQYSEQFIAPQVTDGQILSDDTIGINLNGRRNGYYYTPIVAWDDENYSYVGLKVENGRIVSCPLNEAQDFYFAIIEDIPVDDTLTTVSTIDNNLYGITMRMIDFTTKQGSATGSIQNEQDRILGNASGGNVLYARTGLLSTDLDPVTGYPTAVLTGDSLYDLFNDPNNTATPANHLFLQSIYNASGYFEYNSTQNFASLGQDGDFVVYQELGTMDNGDRPSLKHGQFMPYNDLQAGVFSSVNSKNLYNAEQNPLANSDPRKNEQLYLVSQPDYFFGMELEASFIQTPSGHDAWGHDIIYEFTGDDDFWLYVDGELVIDLGGIHSALPGSVNFCTGQVSVNGVSTTLRDIFYNNYIGRGHSVAEAEEYIEENFEQNEQGQWVFKDYTTHTMRIFYMERGAGASNLYMRFNLASVKPGTVLLSKELGNVDETESVLAEYPYQIWYMVSDDADEHLLTEDNLNIKVYYKDTITPVTYKPSLTFDGLTYNSVFLLKPGEVAEINLPDEAISYRIVECGINTDVYESVEVNGTEINGTAVSGNNHRMDYGIEYEASKTRPRVVYRNNVDPAARRNLTIRKVLYDETGLHELHTDSAIFTMRAYFGTEYEDGLSAANMVTYHVKDENGNYCVWNVQQQAFVSIGETDYTQLTDAQKRSVSFTTSMNGSISKIPSFYTIEFREILAGTQFKIEERDYEIPDGYSLQKYVLYPNGLNSTGTEMLTTPQDTVVADQDPHVDVCNLKGWGLRVNKQWSDEDYMAERSPVYFAVYTGADEAHLTLVPNTIYQMPANNPTLYWYFQTLPVAVPFEQYEIREVTVVHPVVDSNGMVTHYDTVSPVAPDGEVRVVGRQKGESEQSEFAYTVLYDKGEIELGSNVRVDTVTNNRPGIILKKMLWDGTTPLEGAEFTLTDDDDMLIGTFTSDEDGLITVAFLRDDVDYSLLEIKTPQGYYGIDDTITLCLNNGTVTVSGIDQDYYVLTQGAGQTPTLVIKNRPYDLEVVKQDADTEAPLAGVQFALHRQVTVNGVTTIDFNPMPGYETLTTDANGVIPRLDNTLAPGTYELREKRALSGYDMLEHYIRFTVSKTGEITLVNPPADVDFTTTQSSGAAGTVSYVLTVPNYMRRKVSIWKTDASHNTITTGASFNLYRADEFDDQTKSPITGAEPIVSGTTGANGILALGELPVGEYRLVETSPPPGYIQSSAPVQITVSGSGVTAIQSRTSCEVVQYGDANGYWVSGQDTDTWQIRVCNYAGAPLPDIGGVGTRCFYLFGSILLILGGSVLVYKKRRRFLVHSA